MGIQVKLFYRWTKCWESLECMFPKFELPTSSHFQDIAVQNSLFTSNLSVAILLVLWQKIVVWNVGLNLPEK